MRKELPWEPLCYENRSRSGRDATGNDLVNTRVCDWNSDRAQLQQGQGQIGGGLSHQEGCMQNAAEKHCTAPGSASSAPITGTSILGWGRQGEAQGESNRKKRLRTHDLKEVSFFILETKKEKKTKRPMTVSVQVD